MRADLEPGVPVGVAEIALGDRRRPHLSCSLPLLAVPLSRSGAVIPFRRLPLLSDTRARPAGRSVGHPVVSIAARRRGGVGSVCIPK